MKFGSVGTAAPWAGPDSMANKAPTETSIVSAINANGRRALLMCIFPSLRAELCRPAAVRQPGYLLLAALEGP